jgi:DNA-binding MarR family transcriptional regulator
MSGDLSSKPLADDDTSAAASLADKPMQGLHRRPGPEAGPSGTQELEAGRPPDWGIVSLRDTLLALVRRDGRDLTARQLTVFLTVYQDDALHSVTSLAHLLRISRSGITRVAGRLVSLDLISCEVDKRYRRRVLMRRTLAGTRFNHELSCIIQSSIVPIRDGLLE